MACRTFTALQRPQYMEFTYGWQWFSPITHKHNGIQTVRFNFPLKGLMKGLNKLCLSNVHVLETMNTQSSMHGPSSIVAFRCKLKNLEFQTNGGSLTWYAPTVTPLTPYFNPLHQLKTHVFTKKCSPQNLKSCFSTLSKILETVHSKTPNWLEKRYPNAPYFYGFCHWKTPIFCLACKVMLLPQTRSEAGKFCILETESCNLVNTFRCKFQVMKTKFKFYRLNWPNCYGRSLLEGRDDTQVIIPWSNTEGDISYNHPLYDSAPGSLNKCQVYLKLNRSSTCKKAF